MARKYSDELRERATRMAVELRRDPETKTGAVERVAEQLGMHPMTLRKWVRQAEVDDGEAAGVPTETARELRELRRKTKELEQTIEILKAATTFFARECDPLHR